MTYLMLICALVVFGAAAPGNLLLTPQRAYRLGFTSEEPPTCREPNDGEKRARGLEPKGKAATFSINGEYLCERRIFDYGQRDSYVDFVLDTAAGYSLQLARRAKLLSETEPDLGGRTWTVTVKPGAKIPDSKLAFIFRTALSQSLGTGKVNRSSRTTSDDVRIEIVVRPTPDSDILFGAVVKTDTKRGTLTWLL